MEYTEYTAMSTLIKNACDVLAQDRLDWYHIDLYYFTAVNLPGALATPCKNTVMSWKTVMALISCRIIRSSQNAVVTYSAVCI